MEIESADAVAAMREERREAARRGVDQQVGFGVGPIGREFAVEVPADATANATRGNSPDTRLLDAGGAEAASTRFPAALAVGTHCDPQPGLVDAPVGMQFRVLGPVEVVIAGAGPVQVSAAKPRTVLAVLLCAANRVVSTDRLIDAVWGADPPRTASQNLRLYVHQLRSAVGDPRRIVWRPPGYALLTSPGEVDADRFAALAEQGTAALAGGDAARAAALLRRALGLWRGQAYAGLDDVDVLRDEAVRLAECRHAALEARIEADLALGRHGELVAELGVLVAADPLRERWRGQLMRALHRGGRQGDALAVYRETRRLLADELGLEPGGELRALERAILRGEPDPSPIPPSPAPAPTPVPAFRVIRLA